MNFDKIIDRRDSNSEKYHYFDDDILPMWVADMDIATPQFILDDIKARLNHPILGYEMISDKTYQAQIDWLKYRYDLDTKREWFLYSPSILISINIAITTFSNIGDEIIAQPPIYPPFISSIINQNRVFISNPLKKDIDGIYRFDIDDFKSKITPKTKIFLLCSPHNPVGRVWSIDELKEIIEICNKHNIIIISDEIHSDLSFTTHTPSIKISQDNIISLQGVGKTFNISGMSISTIMIPNRELREKFKINYNNLHLGEGNILSHIAFESAYNNAYEYIEKLLEYIKSNFGLLENLVNKYPNKIRFIPPQASYLAWIDFNQLNLDDNQLHKLLKNRKLGLSQGVSFGDGGSGYMRMNCAVPKSVMIEAIKRLEKSII